MFRINQIIAATNLLKNFTQIIRELSYHEQAILITTKSQPKFVFLNAQLYEELLDLKFEYFQKLEDLKS